MAGRDGPGLAWPRTLGGRGQTARNASMEPEETGSRRSHGYVPWLLAGVGAASLVGWTLAGICSWRTNQACTVGFTVGPLVPAGSPAPEAPDIAIRPAPRVTPSAASRTAIDSPPATQVARAPATIMQVPSAGNPETANPDYVALVIGNASYETQTKLKNPHNDARAIADSLRSKNYTLVGGGPQLDLSLKQFNETLTEFKRLARNAHVAIVYYAGHGIQIDDEQPIYLIPVDAKLEREGDLVDETIELKRLQLPARRSGNGKEQILVLILDACRTSNFPLEGLEPAKRGTGQRGLKAVPATDRSFIAFSASSGEPASDGEGENSPYAKALLSAMEPRQNQLPVIKDVFSRVDETFRNNGQRQNPEKSDKLGELNFTLAAPQKPRPVGWTGRDCPQCPEIKILEPGSFMIGSPETETDFDDERPRTRITFKAPFAIGKTEVTFAEFDACHKAGYCDRKPSDEGWGRGNLPVINVTRDEAIAYTRWLRVMTGNTYRLPSEAEWEYAARAGTTTAYPWGPEPRRDQANYGAEVVKDLPPPGKNAKAEGADVWLYTAPVGSLPKNPWGLSDMHGNVAEWIADCYPAPYSTMDPAGRAFLPDTCEKNLYGVRGGGWDSPPEHIRSAFRDGSSISRSFIGFRVARDN